MFEIYEVCITFTVLVKTEKACLSGKRQIPVNIDSEKGNFSEVLFSLMK